MDLMKPSFGPIAFPCSKPEASLLHLSCGGNQTAVVVTYEHLLSNNRDNPGDDSNDPTSNVGSQAASAQASKKHSNKQTTKGPQAQATPQDVRQELFLWGTGKSLSQMKVPVRLPSPKCRVQFLSCGHEHAGFVTTNGQVSHEIIHCRSAPSYYDIPHISLLELNRYRGSAQKEKCTAYHGMI